MRDLLFFIFLCAVFGMGMKRPFLALLAYVYVDVLTPQKIAYGFLTKIPISLISFVVVFGLWFALDKKDGNRFTVRQGLIVVLLFWCGFTTINADFPVEAKEKWDWVWPTLVFATFLPFTLRTKLRMEGLLLFLVLSAGTIVIVGGIKTIFSGGGYGELNLMVNNNSGIFESSAISAIAIAMIPLILYLMRWGTVFPSSDWRVKWFGIALMGACLLIPIGTQARTGLVCAAIIFVLMLRNVKRPILYILGGVALVTVTIPFLPASFTERMNTIQTYKADQSASTRIAVWKWTIDYVKENPAGGGFLAFLQNKIRYETAGSAASDGQSHVIVDEARAYHSSYFEMLGEQGYFGLFLWLCIHVTSLFRMEVLLRRFRKHPDESRLWIADMATSLQLAHVSYLVACVFVGIAFSAFVQMLVGLQIALDIYAGRIAKTAEGVEEGQEVSKISNDGRKAWA